MFPAPFFSTHKSIKNFSSCIKVHNKPEMTTKQIDSMLTQLAEMEEPRSHVSYQLPSPEFAQPRSSHQLVRSVLYMGQLVKGSRTKQKGDFLVDSLETVTSVMDNLYLLTKFGIGKKSRWLQRLSADASKVWFVTLILSIRKIVLNLVRLMGLRSSVRSELTKCQMFGSSELRRNIIQKYESKLEELSTEMTYEWFELSGTLVDIGFVSIELFKWKVHPRLEKLMGLISAAMSFYRMTKSS